MNAVRKFKRRVRHLRAYEADVAPPEETGNEEWENDYPLWEPLHEAWEQLLGEVPMQSWPLELVEDAVYAIARDHECQQLVGDLAAHGAGMLLTMTEFALQISDPFALWQLAIALRKRGGAPKIHAEPLLIRCMRHDDEYVRRRALESLAVLDSIVVEPFALREWNSALEEMPWTRMNALRALHYVQSPLYQPLLEQSLTAANTYLRGYAEKLRKLA